MHHTSCFRTNCINFKKKNHVTVNLVMYSVKFIIMLYFVDFILAINMN